MSEFVLSEQANNLCKKRYFREGEDWATMCIRVAYFLGDSQREKQDFNCIMRDGLFLPNTPTLVNAGKDNAQMSACFFLPIEDNMESIFQTLYNAAQIFKTGGGVGFNFSNLRPEGSSVKTTNGISSGPVSFMKVYDAAIQEIKQGGVRRGAAMGTLRIDHPDIVKFIKCKHIDGKISNFNISVLVTDEFMEAATDPVASKDAWTCLFDSKTYLIGKDGNPFEVHSDVDHRNRARTDGDVYTVGKVFDLVCEQAWRNGEPGIAFWDEIIRKNGSEIKGLNPCSEVMLEDYGVCTLGSIDVSKFVDGDGITDWSNLRGVVETAVDLLNRVLDKNTYPLDQITKEARRARKIGLGIMGWADMLLKKRIRYGSPESLDLASELMSKINTWARDWSDNKKHDNSTVTTIAPTGSISILAGCSSGIEPNPAWVAEHKREDFGTTIVRHPLTKDLDLDDLPDYFVTADQVPPEDHIKMVAAFQKYVDNGISKTILLPENATIEDVKKAYKLAHNLKCKGITVYRYGSRRDQVISRAEDTPSESTTNDHEDNSIVSWEEFTEQMGIPEKRPYCLEGFTFKIPIDMGDGKVENAYLTGNVYEGGPYEIFLAGNIREAAPVVAEYIDTTTRLVSLAMRGGIPLEKIIEQLGKVPCSYMYSVSHKIAQVLKEFLPDEAFEPCPDCGNKIVFSEGCEKCTSCGWARCG